MLSFFKNIDATQADDLARGKVDIDLLDDINEKIYNQARCGYSSMEYTIWCGEDTLGKIANDLASRMFKVTIEDVPPSHKLLIEW